MNVDDVIERQKTLQEIKAAAEKLAERDNDGYDWNANYYLEINDQHGNRVKMSDEQRQALIVGMMSYLLYNIYITKYINIQE